MGRNQVEMFTSLDGLVSEDHPCRRFEAVVDLAVLSGPLVALYSDRGRPEPGAERAFPDACSAVYRRPPGLRDGTVHAREFGGQVVLRICLE